MTVLSLVFSVCFLKQECGGYLRQISLLYGVFLDVLYTRNELEHKQLRSITVSDSQEGLNNVAAPSQVEREARIVRKSTRRQAWMGVNALFFFRILLL